MTNQDSKSQTAIYQIKLQGHLDAQWAEWLGGLTMSTGAEGETVLTGPIIDQAALHGLLRKIRDVGIPLLAVLRLEPSNDNPHRNDLYQPYLPTGEQT